MVERARKGWFSADDARTAPPVLLDRWFERDGDGWRAKPELLRIVRFEASDPGVLRPEASPDGEEVYETPIDEFRLSRYVLPEGGATHDLTRATPQILLCTAGSVRAGEHELAPGQSVFVPAGEQADVTGAGTIFRATVIV